MIKLFQVFSAGESPPNKIFVTDKSTTKNQTSIQIASTTNNTSVDKVIMDNVTANPPVTNKTPNIETSTIGSSLPNYREECFKELGISSELAKSKTRSKDKKFKCFVKCISVKHSFMDASGQIQVDVAEKIFQADKKPIVAKEMKTCLKITESDVCQKAIDVYKCLLSAYNK